MQQTQEILQLKTYFFFFVIFTHDAQNSTFLQSSIAVSLQITDVTVRLPVVCWDMSGSGADDEEEWEDGDTVILPAETC